MAGGLFGLLRRQKTFSSVELSGLRITIPPRTPDDEKAGKDAASTAAGPILIDRVEAKDAQLIIVPKDPRKEPKVFAIHNLQLESVGFNRTMPFIATLTNPDPGRRDRDHRHVRPVGQVGARHDAGQRASTRSITPI